MGQFKQKRFEAAIAFLLLIWCALSSTPSGAQERLLGHHAISIQLKPMSAAEVLNVLSERSKLVSEHGGPSEDEGEPWEVANPEILDGLFVKVGFVRTPVNAIVDEVLGCLGFGYREVGNRLAIRKIAREFSGDRCQGVQRVSALESEGKQPEYAAKSYSWQFDSITALEFVDMWSKATGHNVSIPYDQRDLLRKTNVRVNVSDASDEQILDALTRCIGWDYSKTSIGYSVFIPKGLRATADCRGFSVL